MPTPPTPHPDPAPQRSEAAGHVKGAQRLLHDARPGEAARLLLTAAKAHGGDGQLIFQLARSLQAAGRLIESVGMYRRAAELLPDRHEPLVGLGLALERVRHPVEAVDALNAAIAINASDERANRFLDALARRLAHLEAARERLQATTSQQMPARIRGAALLELGATLDSLGEHEEAFRMHSQGRQLFALAPEAQKHRVGELPARLRSAADEIDADLIASFRRDVSGSARPAPTLHVRLIPMVRDRALEAVKAMPGLAVNVQTPCLAQTARSLEEIVPEAAHSPAAIASLSRSEIASLRARYWAIAEKAFSADRLDAEPLIDAAPLNILHLPLYRAIFPNGRLLLSIRDPRDMALNCFFHRYALNRLTVNFLQFGGVASYLADVAHYWNRVTAAAELPTHVVRSEDLDWSPRRTLSGIAGFLGQPYHAALDRLIQRRAHELIPEAPRTANDPKPLDPLPGHWTRHRKPIELAMEHLRPVVEGFGYGTGSRPE